MSQSLPLSVPERLERIAAVADDLSRELVRNYRDSPALRAMAEQLRDDAGALLLAMKPSARIAGLHQRWPGRSQKWTPSAGAGVHRVEAVPNKVAGKRLVRKPQELNSKGVGIATGTKCSSTRAQRVTPSR